MSGPLLLEAALEAAAAGWAVHPCAWTGPRAKAPLLKHGFHQATTDPALVEQWWGRWPHALIGASVPDALLVLDIDPRNGGSLQALEAVTGPLPTTMTVWSGRGDGGRHLYFHRPEGQITGTQLPVGIDLKANGYTILPPSPHPATGQPYTWHSAPVAHLSTANQAAITPPPRRVYVAAPATGNDQGKAVAGLLRSVAEAPEGRRNDIVYWASRAALDKGRGDVLSDILDAAITAGLPQAEAVRTITSAGNAHQRGASTEPTWARVSA